MTKKDIYSIKIAFKDNIILKFKWIIIINTTTIINIAIFIKTTYFITNN